MPEAATTFRYTALDASGAKVRGQLTASAETLAFARLREEGLSPLSLKAEVSQVRSADTLPLSDRAASQLFESLGTLLKAGADIRTSLTILMDRSASRPVAALCRALLTEVSGGGQLDTALARRLPRRQAFVAALLSAGQASGDIGGSFERAAAMLASRCRMRDQLVSTLGYPMFVLFSTVSAFLVILLFIVPALAPLVSETGSDPPAALRALVAMSNLLTSNLAMLVALVVTLAAAITVFAMLGLLSRPIDRLLLDGPGSRIRSALVYGGFAIALGNMLSAGAPLGSALRLAIRTTASQTARDRLEATAVLVRQGEPLSRALEQVRNFPTAICRMCVVGESSGSLGTMLSRGGRLEEEAAIRRIEAVGRFLGPALIVLLGGSIGLLMATLLSGVSQIGQGALQ